MTTLQAIRPAEFPWFDYSRFTFSLGLTDGTRAWLSGHSASEYDAETGHIVVRGGMADQTRTAYAKIAVLLEAAHFGFGDVHRVVEYVTTAGIDDYAAAARVRKEVFGTHSPSVCPVVVNRLLRPAALIEIEVSAGAIGDLSYLPWVGSPPEDLGSLDVAKAVIYTTPATPRAAVDRWIDALPGTTAMSHVVLARLAHPNALVMADVIASREPVEPVAGGTRTGQLLFLCGRTASEGDVVAQAEAIYARIVDTLRAAGAKPEHLVKTVEYVTARGLDRYREVGRVREQFLVPPYPASTGAVCESLPDGGGDLLVDAVALISA